jgi:hypothetical protein
MFVALLTLLNLPVKAQTFQFLPEVDAYSRVNSDVRIYFQAKETREGGDPTKAELGPSVEFYLKPWLKLKDATIFDLDEAKKRDTDTIFPRKARLYCADSLLSHGLYE